MLESMYAPSQHAHTHSHGQGHATTSGDFGSGNDHLDAMLADYNDTYHNGKTLLDQEYYQPMTYGHDDDVMTFLSNHRAEDGALGGGAVSSSNPNYDSSFGTTTSSSGMSTTSSLSNMGSPQYYAAPSSTASSGSHAFGSHGNAAGTTTAPSPRSAQSTFAAENPTASSYASASPPFGPDSSESQASDARYPSLPYEQSLEYANAYGTARGVTGSQLDAYAQGLTAAHADSSNSNGGLSLNALNNSNDIRARTAAYSQMQSGIPSFQPAGLSFPSQGQADPNANTYLSPDAQEQFVSAAHQYRLYSMAQAQGQAQAQAIAQAQAVALAQNHQPAQSFAAAQQAAQLQATASLKSRMAVNSIPILAKTDGTSGRPTKKSSPGKKAAVAQGGATGGAAGSGPTAVQPSSEAPRPAPVAVPTSAFFNFSFQPTTGSGTWAAGSDDVMNLIANAGTSMARASSEALRTGLNAKMSEATVEAQIKAEQGNGTSPTSDGKAKKSDKGHSEFLGSCPGCARDTHIHTYFGSDAVERRYRNNINNHLSALRDAIPALRHLKPLPSMPVSRRRVSQFTLTTGHQLPTPEGLIDGIPAAKTLSKGTVLGKAIEYIHYLQHARSDGQEDVQMFKKIILEMVGNGQALVDIFEARRAIRNTERAALREKERVEQEALDEEDDTGSGEDEADEAAAKKAKAKPTKTSSASKKGGNKREAPSDMTPRPAPAAGLPPSVVSNFAQLRQQQGTSTKARTASSSGTTDGFSPSSISSTDDFTVPDMRQDQSAQTSPSGIHSAHSGRPRVLLASFLGLSFAGGLGYDWTYSDAPVAQGSETARAWAGRLVGRSLSTPSSGSAVRSSSIISSDVLHPGILSGLVFLGIASICVVLYFVLNPNATRSSSTKSFPISSSEVAQSRSVYRQRRRAQALAALASLTEQTSTMPLSFEAECRAALAARKQLLKLVGAPTYALLPSLAKETLAALLRKVTTIRVGSFARWSEKDRVEAAVAWVRIAEIEATVGADDVNFLARCYTFLRLFNLSHSASWPETTPSTNRASVNAILSVHLLSLGEPLSAHALFNKAVRHMERSRKKMDARLHPWAEIALATDWSQFRQIVRDASNETVDGSARRSTPSDTSPLLQVAEARCSAALLEAWAKIFVGVVATTCPPPPSASRAPVERFADLVDQPFLEETVAHVLDSTVVGSTVHTMAQVTKTVCAFYNGDLALANYLMHPLRLEYNAHGPARDIASVKLLFKILPSSSSLSSSSLSSQEDSSSTPSSPTLSSPSSSLSGELDFDSSSDDGSTPSLGSNDVDHLASIVLNWLLIRRRLSFPIDKTPTTSPKADPALHRDALAVRRQFAHAPYLNSTSLREFCESFDGGDDTTNSVGRLSLDAAVDACLESLTSVTRRAAGLKAFDLERSAWADGGDDSGVELD
ncbi:BZ3500_MvSof-1268-A1-R1_Chr9g10482 [Microbotryum saponariae]|uniref:BZ3500_MvSof-1268-A1-R1_Chr9g10482 protein n=1 Tax=Microbotryum saponariae TaxID=289078 RepID=A0A2X0N4L9_9BASI|nr:BZ3501_MvSof-1269-A2-R1_Chr9g10231 [Microbotryum saponariae]SDA00166.1 BZ3500_MvSof-1268-A1-R1_Chr9g10482 [Microbotryum saponariae]